MGHIKDNLNTVRANIERAAKKSGRNTEDITLVAVSKTKGLDLIEEAIEAGALELGENKVQEVREKFETVDAKGAHIHMIGHLQRNKVKYIMDKVTLIHSVDSLRIAEKINEEAEKRNMTMELLVQLNCAEEESKFGLKIEELEKFLMDIKGFKNIKVKGLMTVPPFVQDPEDNRHYFSLMKELFIDIKQKNIDNIDMEILSMGMSGDYEVAIEEGATMVRVGTGIFGARDYTK